MHFADEADDFASAKVIIENGLVREIAYQAHDLDAVAEAIEAADPGGAARGLEDSHEHADGCGLAGAVGAQEGEEFARADIEGEMGYGIEVSVALGKVLDFDKGLVAAEWVHLNTAPVEGGD
jgi:hypothetical protein